VIDDHAIQAEVDRLLDGIDLADPVDVERGYLRVAALMGRSNARLVKLIALAPLGVDAERVRRAGLRAIPPVRAARCLMEALGLPAPWADTLIARIRADIRRFGG
jgi:hypothetical protein